MKPYDPIHCSKCGMREVEAEYEVSQLTNRLYDHLNDIIKVAVKVGKK